MKNAETVNLTTPFAEGLEGGVWEEYPRPSLVRDSYLSLNGIWEIEAKDFSGKITVPFAPESLLSGIGKSLGEALVYRRKFTIPKGFDRGVMCCIQTKKTVNDRLLRLYLPELVVFCAVFEPCNSEFFFQFCAVDIEGGAKFIE